MSPDDRHSLRLSSKTLFTFSDHILSTGPSKINHFRSCDVDWAYLRKIIGKIPSCHSCELLPNSPNICPKVKLFGFNTKQKTKLYVSFINLTLSIDLHIYLDTRASFRSVHSFRRTVPMHLLAFCRELFCRNKDHQWEWHRPPSATCDTIVGFWGENNRYNRCCSLRMHPSQRIASSLSKARSSMPICPGKYRRRLNETHSNRIHPIYTNCNRIWHSRWSLLRLSPLVRLLMPSQRAGLP